MHSRAVEVCDRDVDAASSHTERVPGLVWISAATLVVLVTDLGQRVFATNDEARFAVLAQNILSSGHWLFPALGDTVYHNKPLLQAWLIAAMSWPTGHVTALTAVLPSALAAWATALVVYALGRELFGRAVARYSALIFITTHGVFLHARVPLPDMLMTFFITASMWRLAVLARSNRHARHAIGFYVLAGAGFWAKGLAGLLPLAIAIAGATFRPTREGWRRLQLPLGLPLVAAMIAPWWLGVSTLEPAAVGQAAMSSQLLWYLPTVLSPALLTKPLLNSAEILLPWTFVVPWALASTVSFRRQARPERDTVAFLVTWISVTLALVGFSHQQRLRYYLPLVPAVALWLGWWCATVADRTRRIANGSWRVYVAAGAAAATTVILAGIDHRAGRPAWLPWSTTEAAVLSVLLLIMVTALIAGVRSHRLAGAFPVVWVASASLLIAGYHWPLQRSNAANDYAGLRIDALTTVGAPADVVAEGIPTLPLVFYLGRHIIAVENAHDLQRALVANSKALGVVPVITLGGDGTFVPLAYRRLGGRDTALIRAGVHRK